MFKRKKLLLMLAVLALAVALATPNMRARAHHQTYWDPTEVVSRYSGDDSSYPSLVIGSDGMVHMAWQDYTDYSGSGDDVDIVYASFLPGVGVMPVPVVVSTFRTKASINPSLGVGPNGTIHIAWADWTPYNASGDDVDIFYKKFVPGTGWTTTRVISTESGHDSDSPSLGVGPNGTVHIAWADWSGPSLYRDIFYKKFVPGTGWTTTRRISTESGFSGPLDSNYPSLGVGSDGTVHIAWEDWTNYDDSGDDYDIFYKKFVPGTGWTTTRVISTESDQNSRFPSLGVGSDGIVHIAWMDETPILLSGDDADVFYKRVYPAAFTPTQLVSTESDQSSGYPFGPSLAIDYVIGVEMIHIAWRDGTNYDDSGDDMDIFYKRWVARGPPAHDWEGDWTPTEVVSTESGVDVGYGLSLDVRPDSEICIAWDERTNYDDSGDDMDIFHKQGVVLPHVVIPEFACVVRGNDNHIYHRVYDSPSDSWGSWNVVPGATSDSPAAVVINGRLYLVVRGMDNSLWYGVVRLDNNHFYGWTRLSGSTPSAPTLVYNGRELVLVVRGMDNRVYYRKSFRGFWSDWIMVPTGSTSDSPAAAVMGDYLHLVVRGLTGGLYHQQVYLPTDDYYGWDEMSGDTPSAPALTTNYKDEGDYQLLYLVVRGMGDGIYWALWDGSWTGWSRLPGATSDAPAAAVQPSRPHPDARLHLAVRGLTGGLYHGLYDLNAFSFVGWTRISGDTPSPPTLTS